MPTTMPLTPCNPPPSDCGHPRLVPLSAPELGTLHGAQPELSLAAALLELRQQPAIRQKMNVLLSIQAIDLGDFGLTNLPSQE